MRRVLHAFTLVEVMIAMVILALAAVGTCSIMAASSRANATTGVYVQAVALASNVHEYAMSQTIANMHSLDTTANTPSFVSCIDAQGNSLTTGDFANWTQQRSVTSFAISNPATAVADSATTCKLISVEIRYKNAKIYSTSWVLAPTKQY